MDSKNSSSWVIGGAEIQEQMLSDTDDLVMSTVVAWATALVALATAATGGG